MCIVVNITNINNRFQVTISDGELTVKYPALKKRNEDKIDKMVEEFFIAQRIATKLNRKTKS